MKVLVAYDGSTYADAVIADLGAAGLPRNTEVMVITVAHEGWPPLKRPDAGEYENRWKEIMTETAEYAEKAGRRIQSNHPGWKVTSEPLWGAPSSTIHKTIEHWTPDLVVVGSHGRSAAARMFLGSVSFDLIHRAHCSVRVVRGEAVPPGEFLKILVAHDGSEHADKVIQAVAQRTWPANTEVRVLSIVQTLVPPVPALMPALEGRTYATEPAFRVIEAADEQERARLHAASDSAVKRLESTGLKATPFVLDGEPRKEILAEAERWGAHTIFVGARGLGRFDRLMLGSVSSVIVSHAHCTVEVVRGSSS